MSFYQTFAVKVNQIAIFLWTILYTKRALGFTLLVLSIYYAYKKVQRAYRREADAAASISSMNSRLRMQHAIAPHSSVSSPAMQSSGDGSYLFSQGSLSDSSSSLSSANSRLSASSSEHKSGNQIPRNSVQKYMLSGFGSKRKVCISIECIATIDASSVKPLPDVLEYIACVAQHSELFIISKCEGKEMEDSILSFLVDSGIFQAGMKEHRALFCSTSMGKQAIYRHIEPSLLIENDSQIVNALRPFIDDSVWIRPENSASSAISPTSTVVQVSSIGQFFDFHYSSKLKAE
jgi:hypothetical protein